MKAIIDYYPLDSKVNLTVFGKEIKVAVRLFDTTKGTDVQCTQCCFGQAIVDTAFSGQRSISGYCCGLTVSRNTNCNFRPDGNRIVYKRIVKKQN